MSGKIEVKARIDAGHHRKYGEIIKGRKYIIDANDFGEQLFERPNKNWKAPWERQEEKGD